MKKLQLSLESLEVDSFTTHAVAGYRGTVEGQSFYEPTGHTYCIPCNDETIECGTETERPRMTCGGGPAMTCGPYTE